MSTTTDTEQGSSAITSSPLKLERLKRSQPVVDEPMVVVIAKLASLRERYFSELQAARDKVKKNFLI